MWVPEYLDRWNPSKGHMMLGAQQWLSPQIALELSLPLLFAPSSPPLPLSSCPWYTVLYQPMPLYICSLVFPCFPGFSVEPSLRGPLYGSLRGAGHRVYQENPKGHDNPFVVITSECLQCHPLGQGSEGRYSPRKTFKRRSREARNPEMFRACSMGKGVILWQLSSLGVQYIPIQVAPWFAPFSRKCDGYHRHIARMGHKREFVWRW